MSDGGASDISNGCGSCDEGLEKLLSFKSILNCLNEMLFDDGVQKSGERI